MQARQDKERRAEVAIARTEVRRRMPPWRWSGERIPSLANTASARPRALPGASGSRRRASSLRSRSTVRESARSCRPACGCLSPPLAKSPCAAGRPDAPESTISGRVNPGLVRATAKETQRAQTKSECGSAGGGRATVGLPFALPQSSSQGRQDTSEKEETHRFQRVSEEESEFQKLMRVLETRQDRPFMPIPFLPVAGSSSYFACSMDVGRDSADWMPQNPRLQSPPD
jgi:hypothetical protein